MEQRRGLGRGCNTNLQGRESRSMSNVDHLLAVVTSLPVLAPVIGALIEVVDRETQCVAARDSAIAFSEVEHRLISAVDDVALPPTALLAPGPWPGVGRRFGGICGGWVMCSEPRYGTTITSWQLGARFASHRDLLIGAPSRPPLRLLHRVVRPFEGDNAALAGKQVLRESALLPCFRVQHRVLAHRADGVGSCP